MKVIIGNYYKNWYRSNIHMSYMNKKHGYEWEENTNKFEVFLEKVESTLQSIYNATINKVVDLRPKRKVYVRVDDYDVWNADDTLAHIILPVLIKVRESKYGTPHIDDEDVPENIRSTAATKPKEHEWDSDEFQEARWQYAIGEMIYAFECAINEDWEEQFYSGEYDYIHVPEEIDGGICYTLKEGPNHTFKVDREGMDAAWDRRKNGLRLFGKYYHSLWT
jgi:hypothetical protein